MNEQEKQERTLKEVEKVVNKILTVDPKDPEALELWNAVKDLDYILPEIREKWEKALKNK